MQCPSCKTEMSGFERGGVVLDRCEQCKAVWFDHAELDAHRAYWTPARVARRPRAVGDLSCPRCQRRLEGGKLEGIEVERCPRCFGLFLDRDDLDRLGGLAGLRIRQQAS
jgi:Zn-finger nucleic acid-binding protein